MKHDQTITSWRHNATWIFLGVTFAIIGASQVMADPNDGEFDYDPLR